MPRVESEKKSDVDLSVKKFGRNGSHFLDSGKLRNLLFLTQMLSLVTILIFDLHRKPHLACRSGKERMQVMVCMTFIP